MINNSTALCANMMVIKLQSAALVANLRQEVAETKDTLNKQVEETAQRKAEIMNLNEMIGTLKDQNDEVHRSHCLRETSYVDSM